MYTRYYLEPFFHQWIIKDREDENFIFGPFESEADAYYIQQMLNNEKLSFNKGGSYGEENIKEPHTVY